MTAWPSLLLAVGLAGAAGWLATGRPRPTRRLAKLFPSSARCTPRLSRSSAARTWGELAGRWRSWRGKAEAERDRRAATIELCHSLSAELAAGRSPNEAFLRAASPLGPPMRRALVAAVAAASHGDDIAGALEAGDLPGAEGLVQLAACWRVGVDIGSGFADVVKRLGDGLRDEQAHREEVAAQLAGPRATVKLLAALPPLGLVMAAGLGLDPLAFLLGNPKGVACLAFGIALDLLGLWWTYRLTKGAERLRWQG